MKRAAIALVLMACAGCRAQEKRPTYRKEPVTQMVPHCDVGYELQQWVPPVESVIAVDNGQPLWTPQDHPGYWSVLDPESIPELRDETKYRCSPVSGALAQASEEGVFLGPSNTTVCGTGKPDGRKPTESVYSGPEDRQCHDHVSSSRIIEVKGAFYFIFIWICVILSGFCFFFVIPFGVTYGRKPWIGGGGIGTVGFLGVAIWLFHAVLTWP